MVAGTGSWGGRGEDVVEFVGMWKGNGGDLVSAHHAKRMSLCDRFASLLAAGVPAAEEGAGCLRRLEVIDEGGEMRDSTKLGGMGFDRSARPWACVDAVGS